MDAPRSLPTLALLDSYVPIIDEVAELIDENGGPLYPILLDSIGPFPQWLRQDQREELQQRATMAAVSQYQREVEAPAEEILRERKATNPSKVRKELAFGYSGGNHFRAVLEGIKPDLSGVTQPAGVSSFSLRVSGEGRRALQQYYNGGCVAAADRDVITMYMGHYRPVLAPSGFYLVYDFMGNCLSAMPPLPPSLASFDTHCNMGSTTVVFRHGPPSGDYILVELLPCRLSQDKANLYTWSSSGSEAGHWMDTEVELPFPLPSDPQYIFRCDASFALGSYGACWVGLLYGILLCHSIINAPKFRFRALPDGHFVKSREMITEGRGRPRDSRSMCCSGNMIKFLHIDGEVIKIWVLPKSEQGWELGWHCVGTCLIGSIFNDSVYQTLKLPRSTITPKCPVLSNVEDNIAYMFVDVEGKRYGLILSLKNGSVECMNVCEVAEGVRLERIFPLGLA